MSRKKKPWWWPIDRFAPYVVALLLVGLAIAYVNRDVKGLVEWKPDTKRMLPEELIDLVEEVAAELEPQGIGMMVTRGHRTAEQHYGLMQRLCHCPGLRQLPAENIAPNEWGKYCPRLDKCGVGTRFIEIRKWKLRSRQISHYGRATVDVFTKDRRGAQICEYLDGPYGKDERKSEGAVRFPNAARGSGFVSDNFCVPRAQQILIRHMLDRGFCVGMKDGSHLREAWHFEHPEIAEEMKAEVSGFCISDLSDPNLQKLMFTQNPARLPGTPLRTASPPTVATATTSTASAAPTTTSVSSTTATAAATSTTSASPSP